jgi:alpha-amylase
MRQRLCDFLAAARFAAGFDFPTKAVLQEAVRHCQYDRLRDAQGKPPGLIGWAPELAVTFIDNHDTGSTQKRWPFPQEGVMAGYAYILTHPGMPTLFWEHYFDWGLKEQLVALVALRKRAGVKSDSPVEILAAEGDLYVAKIGGRLVLKLGPRFDMGALLPDAGQGWAMAAKGEGWAVWELPADKCSGRGT